MFGEILFYKNKLFDGSNLNLNGHEERESYVYIHVGYL